MVDHELSQPLTMSLVEKCTGGPSIMKGLADERASDLLKTQVLRLDWQRIPSIMNLDIFTHLRELYLQHNRIQVIEELDTLTNLEFLALGSNRIRRLENLRHLHKLRVLDLSKNMIEDVDTQELPRALVITNLADNPCCNDSGFRQRVSSSLPSLMVLNGELLEQRPHAAGIEECKGSTAGNQVAVGGEKDDFNGGAVTLHVSVVSGSECSIVPLSFPTAGDVQELASRFCADNGLDSDTENKSLVDRMKEAIAGEKLDKTNANARYQHSAGQPGSDQECDEAGPAELDQRLNAILHLQRTRARVMQESMASFEQHKSHLMTETRKFVKRKTDAAHDRSDALEADIKKTVEDARAELQLRRAQMSAENRQFAADMREKIDRVLAERRRETELASGEAAIASSPHT